MKSRFQAEGKGYKVGYGSYLDIENLVSFTYAHRSVKDELIEWALEESDESKAIRIFKVTRKLK